MSQIISVRNSLANEDWVPVTGLAKDHAAGVGTLTVYNLSGFSANWAVQVGNTGQELAEILLLSASTPSGTLGTFTANDTFEHPIDTPIYGIKYNQVVLGVATGGTNTDGTVAVITDGTVGLQVDSPNTIFDYSSGTSTDAYKSRFKNSVTGDQSDWSDWILPGGLAFYAKGRIRDRIKEKLSSAGYIRSDDTIDDWINEWRETLTNAAVEVNEDYCIGTVDIAFSGTAELGTITRSDFKQIRRVWMTSNGQDFYQATKMELNEFFPNQDFLDEMPFFYMQSDNVIGRKPSNSSGTARIAYYSIGTILTNDSDELPHSMRGYTKSFEHYGLGQAYLKDGKDAQYQTEITLAEGDLARFTQQITPRNKTGNEYISFDSPLTPDDWDIIA